ncbi:MAG TPA: c-type cytochrome [Casimicrobiaceae bacterium]|nr:c-type cytochrome [Casimicrobiaceae bacterium]
MRATLLLCIATLGATTVAGVPDFSRPPPQWQVALSEPAKDEVAKSIVATGKGAAIACAGCHGANGLPATGVPFPRLAGLPPEYVAKQLFDYRDGARPSAVMVPIAKALTNAEIGSLALYLSSQPAPAVKSSHASPRRGAQLAREGDNALAIPACADCHGGDDVGGGPILPPLGAQPSAYTTGQLTAFRSGERHNDEGAVMRELSKRLSDADINAIASYFEKR